MAEREAEVLAAWHARARLTQALSLGPRASRRKRAEGAQSFPGVCMSSSIHFRASRSCGRDARGPREELSGIAAYCFPPPVSLG